MLDTVPGRIQFILMGDNAIHKNVLLNYCPDCRMVIQFGCIGSQAGIMFELKSATGNEFILPMCQAGQDHKII